MRGKFSIVLAVVAVILLYLFMGRKTVAASTAPVNQPGNATGGINFISLDDPTGLPVFDPTTAPSAYIKGLAGQSGREWVCQNGTTPAVNAATGAVYCVVPADSIDFSASAPVISPYNTPAAPQGPTQSGGYLGGPLIPQGPTQNGGYLGGPQPGPILASPTPSAVDDSASSGATDPTGLQDDSTIFAV